MLAKILFDPGNKSDRAVKFEGAVTALFNLLGFSANNYGPVPEFKDGVDIVACTPHNNIAVVECTIGLPDLKEKLAKLRARANAIEELLAQSGHKKIQVLPVMVTPLPRSHAEVNIKTANEYRIVVLCKEELTEALNQIHMAPYADRFFNYMRSLLPIQPQQYFAGLLRE